MRKLLTFLKKYDTPLSYGVVFLLFGAAFIFVPDMVLDWLVAIAGAFTVFVSAIKLAVLLDEHKRESRPFFPVEIIKAALLLFFGIMLLVLRSGFAEAICAVLGVYIVLCSGIHLFNASSAPVSKRGKAWMFDIVLTVLLLLFGLWLTVYPLWPGVLVGITLIIFGIELIAQESGKRKKEDKDSHGDGVYYTDDFEDKSDEIR